MELRLSKGVGDSGCKVVSATETEMPVVGVSSRQGGWNADPGIVYITSTTTTTLPTHTYPYSKTAYQPVLDSVNRGTGRVSYSSTG